MAESIFDIPVKSQYLARVISIESVAAFRKSVRTLSGQKSYNTEKYRALILAQNRAKASLKRKNLKPATRARFKTISKVNIPKPPVKRANKGHTGGKRKAQGKSKHGKRVGRGYVY